MFLRVQYKRGIEACAERFNVFYYRSDRRIINSVTGQLHIDDYNENFFCKLKAYTNFARSSRNISTTNKTFLKEILGWEDQMQCFGFWISLTDNQFISSKKM